MIEMRDNGLGRACPTLRCAGCEREVFGDGTGIVLWSREIDPLVAHKGTCDRLVDPHGDLLSMDVETFVDHLSYNALRSPHAGIG